MKPKVIDQRRSTRGRGVVVAVVSCVGREGVSVLLENVEEAVACEMVETSETTALRPQAGDRVVVLLPQERGGKGLLLGRIRSAAQRAPRAVPDQLVLEAGKEIVIRCGESSITVRADGKILIKGKDILSHAKRMNRIKGGAVSIN